MSREIKENELFWARANKSVIIPTKDLENAGYDIYANFEEDFMVIEPHETKMIPTNLACAFSSKYVMILKERGSTGTKGMAQRCGIIDSGYRNLIFVPITNENEIPIIITKDTTKATEQLANGMEYVRNHIVYPYSKAICQAIMTEVPILDSKEIGITELQKIPSKRGLGHLGSSGK